MNVQVVGTKIRLLDARSISLLSKLEHRTKFVPGAVGVIIERCFGDKRRKTTESQNGVWASIDNQRAHILRGEYEVIK